MIAQRKISGSELEDRDWQTESTHSYGRLGSDWLRMLADDPADLSNLLYDVEFL